MNTFNADLGIKVLDAIADDPAGHDQLLFARPGNEFCGTTMCIAGWAAVMSGKYRLVPGTAMFIDMDTGKSIDIEQVATELLGLTPQQAGEVFYTMNNHDALEKLRDLVEKKLADEGRMCDE